MPTHCATPDQKRRRLIAALRAKGMSYEAIGKRLGITKQGVFSLVNKSVREASCKECNAVIARAALANKTARNTFCLVCLPQHPEATFGERLKAYRIAASLTRAELAERSGVGAMNIAHYEKAGSVDPQWSKVRRLAQALGIGLLGLEGLTGDKRL